MDTGEIIKLAAWNHFILYEVSKRQIECPNIEYNLGGQIEYDRIQKLPHLKYPPHRGSWNSLDTPAISDRVPNQIHPWSTASGWRRESPPHT